MAGGWERLMGATTRRSEPRSHERGLNWQAGLVAAFVALLAATVYLCLALADALGDDSLPRAAAVVHVENTVSRLPTAAPTAAEPTPEVRPVTSVPVAEAGVAVPSLESPALLAAIVDAVDDDSDHVAVVAKRVTDGLGAGFNGDESFYAASTFKLAVLYEAELRIARQELSPDDRIFIDDSDSAQDLGTSGSLIFEDDGSITIANILRPMIEVSDNSSAVALMHFLGTARIDASLRALGIGFMTLNTEDLWTDADDLARLMEAVYLGEGVGDAERDNMRELLMSQTVRVGIPGALSAEVAEGVKVGNKTGTWEGAQHDVAFVEAPGGAFVLAILTDGSYEGWLAMHRVARAVYDFFVGTP
jgi:beta-lactamase class A